MEQASTCPGCGAEMPAGLLDMHAAFCTKNAPVPIAPPKPFWERPQITDLLAKALSIDLTEIPLPGTMFYIKYWKALSQEEQDLELIWRGERAEKAVEGLGRAEASPKGRIWNEPPK